MTRQEILAVARPILFNTEMVRAILDGRKTVTRRVVKAPYYIDNADVCQSSGTAMHKGTNGTHGMPYPDSPYKPSDILYVRETWRVQAAHRFEADARIEFKAGGPMQTIQFANGSSQDVNRVDYDAFLAKWFDHARWHPSIHMPKEAARLFLRVIGVRAERLQELNGKDMEKEGVKTGITHFKNPINNFGNAERFREPVKEFSSLWDSTIKPADLPIYGWEANPWVWVIDFERVEANRNG